MDSSYNTMSVILLTRCYKNFEIKKEVGIVINKRKKTRNRLEIAIIQQPAFTTVRSSMCGQMHVQIYKAISSISAGFHPYVNLTNQSRD